ncbi:MFS 1 and/or Sugar tr domain containing protein [Asbolus verrucosus]|uniref:Sialin n=1 Tax=Asbolus verrucosus TaxID=1661398 RepID=A0A482VNV2_ASBVE|nr:MFS 1 and/or Sugar tr domain containing protein [Asbolus verrucosus]
MENDWKQKVSKLFLIPQRYVLGIMGFLSIVTAYTMRVTLSVTITEMVVPSKTVQSESHDCEGNSTLYVASVTNRDVLYDWSEHTQGIILSSFYWGYAITHIPGGLLAEKFGGKYVLGVGVLITAVFTLLTPILLFVTDGDWKLIVAVRVLEGLGQGVIFPSLNTMLASWVPQKERGRMGTLVYAGSQIGTIFSNTVSGGLIYATRQWDSVFYLFGGLGMLWFILWMLLVYPTPETHPFISEKERAYLAEELKWVASMSMKKDRKVPWKHIFTSVPLWAMIAAQIGFDWGFYTMVTDLPKYLKDVLKYKVEQNGMLSALPYLVMWMVAQVGGQVCDCLINRQYISVTVARKIFTGIATIGPAVFIIAGSYAECRRTVVVVLFTTGIGMMGCYFCGLKMNSLDISPHYAGVLMGITNGTGAITGIITPYLVGALTGNRTLLEWRVVFWITFGMYAVTITIYMCFASAKEQWWSDPAKNMGEPRDLQN